MSNHGKLIISNSIFANNMSEAYGGVLDNDGNTVVITGTVLWQLGK